MRVHCVGVGSIGSLVAFHLRRCNPAPNHEFTLLLRNRTSSLWRPVGPASAARNLIYVEADGVRRRIGGFGVETLDATKEALSQIPIRSGGGANRPSHLPPLPALNAIKSHNPPPIIQSLIVTNKAGTTLLALQALRSRLNASSTIVLLQNGMGVHEHLVQTLFTDPDTCPNFIIASTTHGVWSKRPLDVVHAGVGAIQFSIVPDPLGRRDFEARFPSSLDSESSTAADKDSRINAISTARTREDDPKFYSLSETVRVLLRAQNDLGVSWLPMAEMEVVLRRKLAINACVGPITALIDCPNGALYGNMSAHRIVRSVCSEAAETFAAQAAAEGARGRPVHKSWAVSLSRRALEEATMAVLRATSRNYSSMLMDVRNGKLTEIEYINGYLSRIGSILGVGTPTNTTLMELIRMKRSIPSSRLR
jgi:2-dehydropantoate 2-reductase